MMKQFSIPFIISFYLILLASCFSKNTEDLKNKPNFLFILVDDLGYTDLGCYGSSFYETPNLDKLAADGMRFTNGYAACPVCSPTRSSIMTGKYPVNTGITNFISQDGGTQPHNWKRNTLLLPPMSRDTLLLKEVTIAELLKENGYTTFFAGKWHLGKKGFWPEDQGFDINKGGCNWGQPFGKGRYYTPYENPNLDDGEEGEYLTFRLAKETVNFIIKNKDKPFFAFLSFYTVHSPLMVPDSIEQKYEEKKERLNIEDNWGEVNGKPMRLTQGVPVFAGMVEAMDRSVGKVLGKLKELGLDNNTIVIFTSDNGGLATSGGSTSNFPLNAGKGWMYEGGIREPMIIKWPGVTDSGSVSNEIVTSPDFMPTILNIAGIDSPANLQFDGIDISPALKGEYLPKRPIFWHFPHYNAGPPSAAIRYGDYKLIEWFETDSIELFNLSKDIGEIRNLSEIKPEITSKLNDMLKQWQNDNKAKFPEMNPSYKLIGH